MNRKFRKCDIVRLNDNFENKRRYTVVRNKENGLVSLCPVSGGFIVSAHEKNLIKICQQM